MISPQFTVNSGILRELLGRELVDSAIAKRESDSVAQRRALVADLEALDVERSEALAPILKAEVAAERAKIKAVADLEKAKRAYGSAKAHTDSCVAVFNTRKDGLLQQLRQSAPSILNDLYDEVRVLERDLMRTDFVHEKRPTGRTDRITGDPVYAFWSTRPTQLARLSAVRVLRDEIYNAWPLRAESAEDFKLEFDAAIDGLPEVRLEKLN